MAVKHIFRFLVLIVIASDSYSQETNIINYYASNNQVIGVPVIGYDNIFRFYPDVAFHNAIRSVRVYYFVSNDVFESYLIKQKDGRYWECPLRSFSLGESIQRVEVAVDCDKYQLNELLRQQRVGTQEDDFNNYLLLRRGDDRALLAKSLLQREANKIEELKRLNASLQMLDENLKNNMKYVKDVEETLNSATKAMLGNKKELSVIQEKVDDSGIEKLKGLKLQELIDSEKTSNESIIQVISKIDDKDMKEKLKTATQAMLDNKNALSDIQKKVDASQIDKLKALIDTVEKSVNSINEVISKMDDKDMMEKLKTATQAMLDNKNTLSDIQKKVDASQIDRLKALIDTVEKSVNSINQVISNKIATITEDIDKLIHSTNINHQQAFIELSQTQSSSNASAIQTQIAPLYSAYVENRNSSLLDVRYKDSDKDVIEFTYRNDKNSLKYLQAADPIERLSIFRARLVPFAIYGEKGTSTIKWRRDRVIYEVALNFGYSVVKDDNFKPVFFDLNRLGIGIGIAADTFGDDPSFLSLSLSYDINSYSTISFGTNIVDKPLFFMGVGINSRAFKDLVKESAKLFTN